MGYFRHSKSSLILTENFLQFLTLRHFSWVCEAFGDVENVGLFMWNSVWKRITSNRASDCMKDQRWGKSPGKINCSSPLFIFISDSPHSPVSLLTLFVTLVVHFFSFFLVSANHKYGLFDLLCFAIVWQFWSLNFILSCQTFCFVSFLMFLFALF